MDLKSPRDWKSDFGHEDPILLGNAPIFSIKRPGLS